ncbi:hypothetical protein ACB094_11G166900 [Castanea mollissima]
MVKLLSKTFRSVKIPNPNPSKPCPSSSSSASTTQKTSQVRLSSRSWSVYLIISTNTPIKTYVGVTTDFSRRLKQHNGELKGGAKASRSGRPWVCACIIQGFKDQSEACEFESKWKNVSKKLPRKNANDDMPKHLDESSLLLLQKRQAALDRVKGLLDCGHLEIDWQLNPH